MFPALLLHSLGFHCLNVTLMVSLLCFSCIFFRPFIFFSPVHWRVLHSRFPTLPRHLSFCCTGLKINTDSNAFQVSVHFNMLCSTSTPRLAPLPCELTLDDLFFYVHALYVSTVLLPLTPYKMCFHLQRMFLCLQYSENSISDRFDVSNTTVNLS